MPIIPPKFHTWEKIRDIVIQSLASLSGHDKPQLYAFSCKWPPCLYHSSTDRDLRWTVHSCCEWRHSQHGEVGVLWMFSQEQYCRTIWPHDSSDGHRTAPIVIRELRRRHKLFSSFYLLNFLGSIKGAEDRAILTEPSPVGAHSLHIHSFFYPYFSSILYMHTPVNQNPPTPRKTSEKVSSLATDWATSIRHWELLCFSHSSWSMTTILHGPKTNALQRREAATFPSSLSLNSFWGIPLPRLKKRMATKYIKAIHSKKYSASSAIREMYIKAASRLPLTSVGRGRSGSKCWEGYTGKGLISLAVNLAVIYRTIGVLLRGSLPVHRS